MLRHCTGPRERLAVVGRHRSLCVGKRWEQCAAVIKALGLSARVWGLVRKFGGCDQAWFSMCLMSSFGAAVSVATVPAAIWDMGRTNHMAGVFSAV